MTTGKNGWFNGILDIYHGDDLPLTAAKDAGIVAVIHKASEGATYADPSYSMRRHEARGLGLLWGAYHFSSGKPPELQAENFLSTIQWGADPQFDMQTLLCLDFENSHSGPNMSFQEACTFVSIIRGKTGRWPVIYGSNLITDADKSANASSAASNCPLWFASYNDAPQNVPQNVWKTLTLWQFTDGDAGPMPHVVANERLDRSAFLGTEADLRAAWPQLVQDLGSSG